VSALEIDREEQGLAGAVVDAVVVGDGEGLAGLVEGEASSLSTT